jgi:hypothetical protein
VVVVTVVVLVVAGCDVEELIGVLLAGGEVADVGAVGARVVGAVGPRVVDVGGGLILPGTPTDVGVVVCVGVGCDGEVDRVVGTESLAGAVVVDAANPLVTAFSGPSKTVVSRVLGSAVTELAPEGRRMPPAERRPEPTTSASRANAPTRRRQAPHVQIRQPQRAEVSSGGVGSAGTHHFIWRLSLVY